MTIFLVVSGYSEDEDKVKGTSSSFYIWKIQNRNKKMCDAKAASH